MAGYISSTSSSLHDKPNLSSENHFKWTSIWRFVHISYVLSSSSFNFDIFSRATENDVRIYDFLALEVAVGMTYMCMDLFIKQYTRRLDFNANLNPLLRGVNYAILLQTGLWILFNCRDLADCCRFLLNIANKEPSWTKCFLRGNSSHKCVSMKEIVSNCQNNKLTKLNITAAHLQYVYDFEEIDKNTLTTRIFTSALVWLMIFLISTVSEKTLLKFCKFAFLCRCLTTTGTAIFLIVSDGYEVTVVLAQMLTIKDPNIDISVIDHIIYTFSIGLAGVYDFGAMSPYTMVDNAVVIFTIVFSMLAFLTSFVVRNLHESLLKCVEVEITITPHYLLFVIFPLGAELKHAQTLYSLFLYLNLVITLTAYSVLVTLYMTRILNSELKLAKNDYIIGVICILGLCFSYPLSLSLSAVAIHMTNGLLEGFRMTVLFLGAYKTVIIMWIYGVKKFCMDIQFWLGFKPTKFWKLSWALLPVVLFGFLVGKMIYTINTMNKSHTEPIVALSWFAFTLLILMIIQIKTVAKYVFLDNLIGVFKCSPKYGPIDIEDRKKRQRYNEIEHHRHCTHGCIILDDILDCNHMPVMFSSRNKSTSGSEDSASLTHIYEASPTNPHDSVMNFEGIPTRSIE